jgi:hypothetical protein
MDTNEITQLAGAVTPYVTGLATAYGSAVLQKVRDQSVDASADATIGLGRRMLNLILGRSQLALAVESAVQDVATNPGEDDFSTALKVQIYKALTADPGLARELAKLVNSARMSISVTASGERSIAAHTVSGIASTGDNTQIEI